MQDTVQDTVSDTGRSEVHATFTIERELPAPVERVWRAFSDDEARDAWFGGGDHFDVDESRHDFRVGGGGVEDGQWHGGPRSRFVSTYTDIVEHRRIVFTYDMWIDGRHISTSLQTLRFDAVEGATRLALTEQGVHLDGLDAAEQREEGTRGLLDQLEASLTR